MEAKVLFDEAYFSVTKSMKNGQEICVLQRYLRWPEYASVRSRNHNNVNVDSITGQSATPFRISTHHFHGEATTWCAG